jgi:hypothetical protein
MFFSSKRSKRRVSSSLDSELHPGTDVLLHLGDGEVP